MRPSPPGAGASSIRGNSDALIASWASAVIVIATMTLNWPIAALFLSDSAIQRASPAAV